MTTQITVRLPDDLVAWVDAEVEAGRLQSRTHAVTRALTRAKRRQISEQDLRTLLAAPADSDEANREEWQRTREFPAEQGKDVVGVLDPAQEKANS